MRAVVARTDGIQRHRPGHGDDLDTQLFQWHGQARSQPVGQQEGVDVAMAVGMLAVMTIGDQVQAGTRRGSSLSSSRMLLV